MGARQREWARCVRAKLIADLGGRCAIEGCEDLDLTFDHPYGRGWTLRDKDTSWRMSIIREEALKGLVRLLCRSHNSSLRPSLKTRALRPKADDPF